jgi:hypothetical protein
MAVTGNLVGRQTVLLVEMGLIAAPSIRRGPWHDRFFDGFSSV